MNVETIQNKSLKKLIAVATAWKYREFSFQRYKQYPELYKISKLIGCSHRTAWDYFHTLKTILNELNVQIGDYPEPNPHQIPPKPVVYRTIPMPDTEEEIIKS